MAEGRAADDSHARHDALLIASMLDPDLSTGEREVLESRIATCPGCAALHADLLVLSAATSELPTPVRTRDFRLTADAATTLVAESPGEPHPTGGRLIGDMQHPMTDHATHDQLLIAGLVDRSVAILDRERAEELIASCDDCAALHRDLVALNAATRDLPTPARLRDFSLSPADVERLRPNGLRRLIAAIGSSRDIFSRPLAIGLTTLGLAGLLVSTIPGALSGQAGAAPAVLSTVGAPVGGDSSAALGGSRESAATAGPLAAASIPSVAAAAPAAPAPSAASAAGLAPSPAPSVELHAPVAPSVEPVASGSTFDTMVAGPEVSTAPAGSADAAAIAPNAVKSTQGPEAYGTTSTASTPMEPLGERSGLIVLAIVMLIVGLGLFGLRWTARRLGNG